MIAPHALLALALLVLMGLTILALARARNLYAVMILMGTYSGFIAVGFALLGAVDVSFTEIVVGSSISTILMMLLLKRVNTREIRLASRPKRAVGALVALGLAAVLMTGVNALHPYGAEEALPNHHVAPYYIDNSLNDMKTPNLVTAVLADYRSFDTLIEAAVVLTAALACMLVAGIRDPGGRKPSP